MNPLAPLNLGGNRRTMRHTEHSLDRLPTRGMPAIPARGDPVSDGSTGERGVGGGDGSRVGGFDFGGEGVEQVVFVCEHVGLAVEDRCQVAPRELVEEWQGFVTNPVAQMGRITIAWIIDRVESKLAAERLGFGAPQRQDRMTGAVPVRGQPGASRTAQQIEQHRLGPIVKRVPGRNDGGQHVVPSGAGAGLEIRSWRHAHTMGNKLGAELSGGSSHQLGFRRGPVTQPVIDVVGSHSTARGGCEHQQRGGVGPARHGAVKRGPRVGKRAARQQLRHRQNLAQRRPFT